MRKNFGPKTMCYPMPVFIIGTYHADGTPLITHRFPLKDIEKAYHIFENKMDNVIKIAIEP